MEKYLNNWISYHLSRANNLAHSSAEYLLINVNIGKIIMSVSQDQRSVSPTLPPPVPPPSSRPSPSHLPQLLYLVWLSLTEHEAIQ